MSTYLEKRQYNYDLNYQCSNSRAYTEDLVEVHNIFVYSVAAKLTEVNLRDHFRKYGNVLFVRLKRKRNCRRSRKTKTGFVYFQDGIGACRALQAMFHQINGSIIYVKAADSWRQPKFAREEAMSIDDNQYFGTKLPGLHGMLLPFLMELLRYLKLKDQINLARTSVEFQDVFILNAKLEHKVCDFKELQDMTLWQIQCFFKMTGQYIETINISCDSPYRGRIFNFISDFCRNVKTLIVHGSYNWYCLRQILMSTLETVELNRCPMKHLSELRNLPNLKSLVVKECSRCHCEDVALLYTLKDLTLYNVCKVDSGTLIDIFCELSTNLTRLNLQKCTKFNWSVLTGIALYCSNIEDLQIPWIVINYQCLVLLPKLRRLELMSNHEEPVSDTALEAFAYDALPKLEYLKLIGVDLLNARRTELITHIHSLKYFSSVQNNNLTVPMLRQFGRLQQLEVLVLSHSSHIDTENLVHVVDSCPFLRALHVQFSPSICKNFALECGKVLQKRRFSTHLTLKIFVHGTAVNETPDEAKYPLIVVDFDSMGEEDIMPVKHRGRFVTEDSEDVLNDSDLETYSNVDIPNWAKYLEEPQSEI